MAKSISEEFRSPIIAIPTRRRLAAYFEVTSCDQSAAKANQLGAKFCLEPMTMENVGRFAILSDLQGATFAIFEASLRAKSKA